METRRKQGWRYAFAIGVAGIAMLLRILLDPLLGTSLPYVTLFAAVALCAYYYGTGPAIVAIVAGLAGTTFWYLAPPGPPAIFAKAELAGAIAYLLFSSVIVVLGRASRRALQRATAASREARYSRRLFETFMNNSPAATYMKDEQGRYVYYNRVCRQRLKMPEEYGKTDEEIFPPDVAAELRKNDALVLRTGTAHQFLETLQEEDGEHTWLSIKFPIMREDGGFLLAGKSLDITDRKRAEDGVVKAREELEERVKERTAKLDSANKSLRELSGRLLQLQDEERRRIARELHDSVGQMLAAVGMNLEIVKTEANKLSEGGAAALHENAELAQSIQREIRTISHLLHPPLLDEVGLALALQWLVGGFSERSNINVRLDLPPELGRLSPELETCVFRIVQECLTNVHRHSGSMTAEVRVALKDAEVEVEVRDDGRGISDEKQAELTSASPTGVGVRGMRERVRQLGGVLEVESSQTGTTVIARLPAVPGRSAGDMAD